MAIEAIIKTNWDVVIVGAGPAGAVSALLLAKDGQKVLLVDKAKFPRDKICGSCLSAKTLGYLTDVGLGDLAAKLGARPIAKFELRTAGGAATLLLPGGVALSRYSLDQAIIERAQLAGVTFLPETSAMVGPCAQLHRSVTLHFADEQFNIKARCVIVADGVNGRSLNEFEKLETTCLNQLKRENFKPKIAANSRIGAGAVIDLAEHDSTDNSTIDSHYQPNIIYMALHKHGYVGLVRMENNKLDLAGAFDPVFTRKCGSSQAAAREILRSVHLPYLSKFDRVEWSGTAPFTRHRANLAARRLFIVGDAASYGEPFTGEGIGWAVKSALLLVPVVKKGLTAWDDKLVDTWQSLHQKHIRNKQSVSLTLGKLLRVGQFSRMLVRVLSAAPFLARPFVATTSKPKSYSNKIEKTASLCKE